MKLFTLDEAEAILPQLRIELGAMQTCKGALDKLREDLERASGKTRGNGHVADEAGLAEQRRRADELVETLNTHLLRINEWGVEIKGLDAGLVDFPSARDGRVVYLCWRLDEDHIGWWHELDGGFAGRQAL